MTRRLLALLVLLAPLAAFGGGCSTFVPVVPVVPVDPVTPVDPVNPGPPKPLPVEPSDPSKPAPTLTWEQVGMVKKGMTYDEVKAALGNAAPKYNTLQDDHVTTLVEWQSVDAEGKPEYLSVRFRGGVVIGRARLPRAVPAPPTPVSLAPFSTPEEEEERELMELGVWCLSHPGACYLNSKPLPPKRRSSRVKVYKSVNAGAGRGAPLSKGGGKKPCRKTRRISLPALR